eukprot:364731-Chlamydomonas_euryale.AAC.13
MSRAYLWPDLPPSVFRSSHGHGRQRLCCTPGCYAAAFLPISKLLGLLYRAKRHGSSMIPIVAVGMACSMPKDHIHLKAVQNEEHHCMVRYVIDFYFYDEKAGTPEAFEIITRPAIDSFENALDRAKMNIYLKFAEWGLPCPISGHQGTVASASAGAQQQ